VSAWRRKALDQFPELRNELNRRHAIETVYQLWFELLPMAQEAHRSGDTDLLRRIYGYAHWAVRHPSKELWNPAAVAFLEHLFDDDASEARMRDVLGWLADDVVGDVWGLWEWRGVDMKAVSRVLQEQRRKVPGGGKRS
jgi:hypothetical protein